jgi:hypothetical protein
MTNLQNAILKCREIAKEHKIRYRFIKDCKKCWNGGSGGMADLEHNKIIIFYNPILTTSEQFGSSFCHELAHFICYKNNKYPIYHSIMMSTDKKFIRGYINTALKAERYVVKMGGVIFRQHFSGRYEKSYVSQYDIDYLNHYSIDKARKMLKQLEAIDEWEKEYEKAN